MTKGTSESTEEKLRECGLNKMLFDGIEVVDEGIADKGGHLVDYITRKQLTPGQVCFVDDVDTFLTQVEQVCGAMDIHCNTFHFRGAEEMFLRVLAQIPDNP